MKYFVLTLAVLATVLTAEASVAQMEGAISAGTLSTGTDIAVPAPVPVVPGPVPGPGPGPVPGPGPIPVNPTLTTPGGTHGLPVQSDVPFFVVPANPNAFMNGGGM